MIEKLLRWLRGDAEDQTQLPIPPPPAAPDPDVIEHEDANRREKQTIRDLNEALHQRHDARTNEQMRALEKAGFVREGTGRTLGLWDDYERLRTGSPRNSKGDGER